LNNKLFFITSKQVANRLTETFDFVWSTATAQWNLRWQVDGFLRAAPTATDAELKDRFASGSGIRGANLRRSCVSTTWEVQQEQFAKLLLIEFCALYEAWIDGVLEELRQKSTHAKDLQFPSTPAGGVHQALTSLQANVSPDMDTCIYPTLLTNRKNSRAQLESLLVCYRYFKECRNSVIHHGGTADQRAVDAYNAFAKETTTSLKVTEVPQHHPVGAVGAIVKLSLRGVVGYGEIVLKLIATLDAELSRTSEAEAAFDRRWRQVNQTGHTLPSNRAEAIAAMNRLVKRLEIPTPNDPARLLTMLRRRKLVALI
jgi:hypothetical protein